MKILFVHSGTELTGSVTYARALEDSWLGLHEVYWANDGIYLPTGRSVRVTLGRRLLPHALWHALLLARYVRKNKIQLVHAHSRRASLVAALISRLTNVPYVVTAHLRTKPRLENRLWPCWGHRTIAICETIAAHLREDNRVPPENIRLIRNGIDLHIFQPQPGTNGHSGDCERWGTVLGRLSGKRWHTAKAILQMLPELLRDFPQLRFRFVGAVAAEHADELRALLNHVNTTLGRSVVEFTGQVDDPREPITKSAFVIAAGRSLMESMAMEVPVIDVGEQSSFGLMTPDSFAAAQQTNFGDFPIPGQEGFNAALVLRDIRGIVSGNINHRALATWGREQIARDYDLEKIAVQVDRVYTEVFALTNLR